MLARATIHKEVTKQNKLPLVLLESVHW